MADFYTDGLKEALLNHVFGDPSLPAYTDLSIRLYTAAPAEDGTGGTTPTGFTDLPISEAADFGAASSVAGVTTKSNTTAFDFGSKTSGGPETIVGAGIVSTAAGLRFYGDLTTSRTVDTGESFSIPIGNFDIVLD